MNSIRFANLILGVSICNTPQVFRYDSACSLAPGLYRYLESRFGFHGNKAGELMFGITLRWRNLENEFMNQGHQNQLCFHCCKFLANTIPSSCREWKECKSYPLVKLGLLLGIIVDPSFWLKRIWIVPIVRVPLDYMWRDD